MPFNQRTWDRLDSSQQMALDWIIMECVRQREVEEWTAEHDATHDRAELAGAAAAYAFAATLSVEQNAYEKRTLERRDEITTRGAMSFIEKCWPREWDAKWFKPKSPFHNLKRAAALCVAEMARTTEAMLTRASSDH